MLIRATILLRLPIDPASGDLAQEVQEVLDGPIPTGPVQFLSVTVVDAKAEQS